MARSGDRGVQAMCSLFRETLEATLHFSCQTLTGLMACSQQAVRQRDGVARPACGSSVNHNTGRHRSGG